ncbi:MAG: carboxypeptidase regulatory-like domain-containing protein, partial [Planctomycetota bacterium]|nr:carboxypeptidase regulatory-like domain-containing protein [Planctomycetota bacterium]
MTSRLALALLLLAGCAAGPAPTRPEVPWADVEVRVLADGAPVPGVEVVLAPELGLQHRGYSSLHRPTQRRQTDDDGVARARVRAREVDVFVETPGFVAHQSTTQVRDGVARAVVSLEPEAPLRGRVLDPAGRPVAGLTVGIGWRRWFSTAVATDATGRFEVRCLAPGWYGLTTAPGPEPHQVPATADVLAPATDVFLTLGTGGAVDVQVVPPPGARFARPPWVRLHRFDLATGEWRREHGDTGATTDPLVERFVHLVPGTYRAALEVPGLGAGVTAPFEVAPGEDVVVQLSLSRGRVVTGRVVDARGAPVDARLLLPWTVADEATPTQTAGGFYLAHAPEAAFDLVVTSVDGDRL